MMSGGRQRGFPPLGRLEVRLLPWFPVRFDGRRGEVGDEGFEDGVAVVFACAEVVEVWAGLDVETRP